LTSGADPGFSKGGGQTMVNTKHEPIMGPGAEPLTGGQEGKVPHPQS